MTQTVAALVDAVRCQAPVPGGIHRAVVLYAQANAPSTRRDGLAAMAWESAGSASTHRRGIPDAVRQREALGRLPQRLAAFTVEAADMAMAWPFRSRGCEPDLTAAVLAELNPG